MIDAPPWEDPRKVLARHGERPSRRYSQNFLVAESVVERIAAVVAPSEGERIIEIGPGVGTLTTALLRRGARVEAIEKDPRMRAILEAELGPTERFSLVGEDAMALDLAAMAPEGRVAVVGNLPYAITGAIFRQLVSGHAHVDRAVLMTQREVATRLVAEPGTKAYGPLGVFVGVVFEVTKVLDVSPGSFHPAPKVRSAVSLLTPRTQPLADPDEAVFTEVVRGAFGQRRKTLRNSLRKVEGAVAAMEELGIDSGRRAETLSLEELVAIADATRSAPERP
ncbi:MAG: ribosomal RNA small subunit methyltransferase A [Deltaproteobacteria bacterium]|nr:ribosomal RNA small subunit methyltransferase A [Deltaproteobacteria bacterium]